MHMDRMHAPLLPLLGSDNLAHQHLAWCQRWQRVQCRSEHILPVTGLCIGAGVSEPIVATVSLDRNCIIHSLASGRLQQRFAHDAARSLIPWHLDAVVAGSDSSPGTLKSSQARKPEAVT